MAQVEEDRFAFDDVEKFEDKKSGSVKGIVISYSAVLILLCLIAISLILQSEVEKSVVKLELDFLSGFMDSQPNSLFLTSFNEYGDSKKYVLESYTFLTDSLLAEPHRSTSIEVSNADSDCAYSWSISTDNSQSFQFDTISFEGDSAVFTFEHIGKYLVNVIETCSASSSDTSQVLFVKYVRRELQSLNEQDRDDFLDSLATLYTTTTSDGILKYGPRFKSVYYFTSIHVDAAGNPVCDEFHSGESTVSRAVFLQLHFYCILI